MAIHDIQSDLQPIVAFAGDIGSDGDNDGAILDTADFELGLMFTLDIPVFVDGSYELQLFESDASDMSGATQIVAPRILPTDSGNSITASAAVAQGSILGKIGAYANLRYVRARVVSTGVTTGATVRVIATQKGEVVPVATS